MDPGLARLVQMIYGYLLRGTIWWKMPAVLVMAFTFFEKEKLMTNNLFDSYPNPLPATKQHCNDPMLGTGYIGCYKVGPMKRSGFYKVYRGEITPALCVTKCKGVGAPFAALYRGDSCLCGKDYPVKAKRKICDCRKKCKGRENKNKICGGRKHMSLYRTYICTEEMRSARQVDGSCNDLSLPQMGSRFYRLGRNFNHSYTLTGDDVKLLEPNPRHISTKLLRRKEFVKAPWLNLLAISWVQFVVHDWFDHGNPIDEDEIVIPLDRDDPMYHKMEGKMKVSRTRPDACHEDPSRPKSSQNYVTHWWDASQLYGSDRDTNERVRAMRDGKLKVDDNGFIPIDKKTKIEITGFSNNWWVGLSLMHNIFTREHNYICDQLKSNHTDWSDQKIFDTARLIISALIAKIHVVEWTPTILNNQFVWESVQVEWYGTLSRTVISWLIANNVTLSPGAIHANIGSPKDLRGVPFTITEEFAAVYRFHSLLPDDFTIRNEETGDTGNSYKLPDIAFGKARDVFRENDLKDIVYTFGTENPGALVLHNYPVTTADLVVPKHQGGGALIDLATIDVIRDRERGIPRYNQYRRLLHLKPLTDFTEFDVDATQAEELREIYNNDIESVDLLVGNLAERRPEGFGFGETSFQLFLLMANRRMVTDRFLTDDFKAEYYTEWGINWVNTQTMKDVLIRAFPDDANLPTHLANAKTAFFDWK